MKKKDSKNYLDFIPEKNPEIEYETGEDGIITVLIRMEGILSQAGSALLPSSPCK